MKRKSLITILMALVCLAAFAGVVDFTGGITYGLNFNFKDKEITPWTDVSGTEGMEAKLTAKVTSTYFTITLQGDLTSDDPTERGIKGYLSFKLGKALNNTYFPNLPSGTFTLLAGNQGAMTALRAYPDYFANYYDRLRYKPSLVLPAVAPSVKTGVSVQFLPLYVVLKAGVVPLAVFGVGVVSSVAVHVTEITLRLMVRSAVITLLL